MSEEVEKKGGPLLSMCLFLGLNCGRPETIKAWLDAEDRVNDLEKTHSDPVHKLVEIIYTQIGDIDRMWQELEKKAEG